MVSLSSGPSVTVRWLVKRPTLADSCVSREVCPAQQGPALQIKQAYVDLRGSVEYIRVQMPNGEYGAQSYTGAFSRVLSLGESISPPHIPVRLSWLGSDATLAHCAAVYSSGNDAFVFPYSFAIGYLSCPAGLPHGDFFPIPPSGFLGFLCVRIARAEIYRAD